MATTSTKPRAKKTASSKRLKVATDPVVLSGFRLDRYGPHHHAYIPLIEGYFEKVQRQEDLYVGLGLPLEGITDFLKQWFHAWEQRSIPLFRDCLSDDLVYADPTGGSELWKAHELGLNTLYYNVWRAFPDFVFYPQDDSQAALPYFDFLDDVVRITVPWRGVGKGVVGRSFDAVGIDRYVMERHPERGWLIKRIDTDVDLLFGFTQVLPLRPRAPRQQTVHRALAALNKVFPSTRAPQVRPYSHG